MDEAWQRFWFALPFGLIIGSFMTVVAARVPVGESIVSPRSKCPSCDAPIRNRDNIPIIGWILLRGRCRDCGARISWTYPALELLTGLLIAAAVAVYDDPWIAAAVAALLALMPAIAVIDIRHRIIPNRLMYPSLIGFPLFLSIAWLAGAPVDLPDMALGALAYGGGLFVIALVSGGMGMGDVKLAAVIGIVLGALGLRHVGVAAAAAIVVGGLGAIAALIAGQDRKSAIPFGPYLAAGAVIAAFWTDPITDWYVSTVLG